MKAKQFTTVYPEGTTASTKEAFEVILKEVNEGTMKGLCLPVGFEFQEVPSFQEVTITLNENELKLLDFLVGNLQPSYCRDLLDDSGVAFGLYDKLLVEMKRQSVEVIDASVDFEIEMY